MSKRTKATTPAIAPPAHLDDQARASGRKSCRSSRPAANRTKARLTRWLAIARRGADGQRPRRRSTKREPWSSHRQGLPYRTPTLP